jgi:streptogramin lyase
MATAGCASHPNVNRAAGPDASIPAVTSGTPTPGRLTVVATLKLHQITHLVLTPSYLWALGGPTRRISEVDPRTNSVVRTFTLPHPAGFGTYNTGFLWLSSFADSVVMQVDPATGHVVRTISGSPTTGLDHPVGLVATGTTVWVVQHRKATLTRIDARTGRVTASTPLPGHTAGDPVLASGRIWVPLESASDTKTELVRVNPATGKVEGSPLALGALACGSGSLADGHLWLTSPGQSPCSNAARSLDTNTATLSPTLYGQGQNLYEVASAGGSTWASDTHRTIYQVDTATGHVTPALTLDGQPDFNRLLGAFDSIWVSRGDTGRLIRINVT